MPKEILEIEILVIEVNSVGHSPQVRVRACEFW